jgi:hypothetical protein
LAPCIGPKAADFGAHSLRAGFLTSAARRGASVFKMRDVSRHKAMDVLQTYVGERQRPVVDALQFEQVEGEQHRLGDTSRILKTEAPRSPQF